MGHGLPSGPEPDEVVIAPTEAPLSVDAAAIPPGRLHESFNRLVLLYGLGQQIYVADDPDQVFARILEAVAALLKIERAFVAVVSDGRLIPRAVHRIDLQGDVAAWPISRTMLDRVISQGISLLTTDATKDTQYGHVRSVDLHNIRSAMCCPLGSRRAPRGLLYVDNRLSTGAFSRSDLEFLTALAHYGSLALNNAEARRAIASERDLAEARFEAFRREIAVHGDIVGVSTPIVHLYGQVRKAARKDVPVLLVGETGTGKEVFARALHACSPRAALPFIAVSIKALSQTLVEAELFGHEKGAFTGADKRRLGRFELAKGGTLFLDEVLDVPVDIQPKLLRVLEQRTFERVGGNDCITADVRIVCACNRNPEAAVARGAFREDLYFRLNAVTLEIPPLRERRADILPLLQHFLRQCRSDKVFEDEALQCLVRYPWPGNVRELKHCVEALDALVDGQRVGREDLPSRFRQSPVGKGEDLWFEPLSSLVARVEREHILRAIERSGGSSEKAIALLKISRAKFFERKKGYGL
jgi:transcriptional regulator with GAF, ATPase, and Fis domain